MRARYACTASAGVLAGKGEQHRDPHHVRLIVGVYLASLPASAKLLPGNPEVLTSLVVEKLLALLGGQLADFVVGSGSHSKQSTRGIGHGCLVLKPIVGEHAEAFNAPVVEPDGSTATSPENQTPAVIGSRGARQSGGYLLMLKPSATGPRAM
jgi:hypothetical protein